MIVRNSIRALLLAAHFISAGSTARPDGMFSFYEANRKSATPNYITADFLLLSYSMTLREALASIEQNHELPDLANAVTRLSAHAAEQDEGEAGQANREFLAVLAALLAAPGAHSLAPAGKHVADEVERVRAATGAAHSDVLAQTLDYSQFRPRGQYTRSPELSRYFQAVRYGGAALFYVKESAATGIDATAADRLTRQAALLCRWIQDDPAVSEWYARSQERRSWLFGPPDDLTAADIVEAVSNVAVSSQPAASPAEWRQKLLEIAKRRGRQPAILSVPLDPGRLESGVTAADALTGWRFLPGSFTPDSAAAQRLVYGNVGKYLGKAKPASLTTVNGIPVKGFPLANETMALLGSREAGRLLKAGDETNYDGYAKAWTEAQRQIAQPAGLPSLQLQMLSSWFAESGGDPGSRLAAARGFWTLARHESVLYTKQSYTGVGKGLQAPDSRKTAWIEPASNLYLHLRRISAQLEGRLPESGFRQFSAILDRCIDISGEEQAGRPLSADAIAFLNGLDQELIRLTGGPDKPVAVDVHTDLNSGMELVEALRYPHEILRKDARGVRFAPQEFKHALSSRITDEEWQQMLLKGEPAR